jgi:hypothetical protein
MKVRLWNSYIGSLLQFYARIQKVPENIIVNYEKLCKEALGKKIILTRLWVDRYKGGYGLLDIRKSNLCSLNKWLLYFKDKLKNPSLLIKVWIGWIERTNFNFLNKHTLFFSKISWKDIFMLDNNLYYFDENGQIIEYKKLVNSKSIDNSINLMGAISNKKEPPNWKTSVYLESKELEYTSGQMEWGLDFRKIWLACLNMKLAITIKDWFCDAFHMKIKTRYYRDSCMLCNQSVTGSHFLFNCSNIFSLAAMVNVPFILNNLETPYGATLVSDYKYKAIIFDNIIILYWNWLCQTIKLKRNNYNRKLLLRNILKLCKLEMSFATLNSLADDSVLAEYILYYCDFSLRSLSLHFPNLH